MSTRTPFEHPRRDTSAAGDTPDTLGVALTRCAGLVALLQSWAAGQGERKASPPAREALAGAICMAQQVHATLAHVAQTPAAAPARVMPMTITQAMDHIDAVVQVLLLCKLGPQLFGVTFPDNATVRAVLALATDLGEKLDRAYSVLLEANVLRLDEED